MPRTVPQSKSKAVLEVGERKSTLSMSKEEYQRRFAKVDALLDEVQSFLNELYLGEMDKGEPPKFKFAIGTEVLVVTGGVYRQGTVVNYYRTAVTETHPRGPGKTRHNVPVSEWIPTLMILPTGMSKKNTFEVAENEVISRAKPSSKGDIQGLLAAHHWNQLHCEREGLAEDDLGMSAFFLEDDVYAVLDKKWQELCGKPKPFHSYCQ